MTEQYITIGKIVNTHGNRGMVRVLPLTDFPERFQPGSSLMVNTGGQYRKLQIEKSFPHKKFINIQFHEVADMNGAEELKGALIQVGREEIWPLPDGSYYIFQILGLAVYDNRGAYLGKVKDVLETGSNDVYIVEKGPGERPMLIPALKSVVLSVDLDQQRITVSLPDGLVDI
ncbi:MAG: ribosome maturation factor RimM [Bacillota bacterium]|jgi:16S rRNA processing protein RimM